MSNVERNTADADGSRRTIFIIVALVSALLVAGVIYLVTRPGTTQTAEVRLEGALRPGSAEFAQYGERIVVDFDPDENAEEAPRPLGDIVIRMLPVVRNFTGRTISGLELRAVALDIAGQPVKERTVIAVPARQPELEPNRTMTVPIMLEGFKEETKPANLRVELTGVKFK